MSRSSSAAADTSPSAESRTQDSPANHDIDLDEFSPDLSEEDTDMDDVLIGDALPFSGEPSLENNNKTKECGEFSAHKSSKYNNDVGNQSHQTNGNSMVAKLQKKIDELYNDSIMTDDLEVIDKYNQLIDKYESMRDSLMRPKSKTNTQKSKKSESKQKSIKIHNNDIPFFQLMDNPQTSKTDNKISYGSAETFASVFETIIKVNDLDIA